jgi:hypothetical protein
MPMTYACTCVWSYAMTAMICKSNSKQAVAYAAYRRWTPAVKFLSSVNKKVGKSMGSE